MHNPACSKSRAALALLQDRAPNAHPPFELDVVDYLKSPLTKDQLRSLTSYLVTGSDNGPALRQLLRNEPEVSSAVGTAPSAEQLVQVLVEHPGWMQRPIAIDWVRGRAVIGRPPEAVLSISEGVGED
ncbi:hypothetical protein BDF19DRAFT_452779 [Syncephalis fuscata]|nr:hypothetical protein BDF19DRAFT_452779 [Syncephalis fuscata]